MQRTVLAQTPEIDVEPITRRWTPSKERSAHRDPLLLLDPPTYVTRLLGQPARAGRKVSCPLHADEHPSLHVYPTAARGWCCFSCGRGGSIYDLAAAVWRMGTRGVEFRRLRQRLLEEFNVELARNRGLSR